MPALRTTLAHPTVVSSSNSMCRQARRVQAGLYPTAVMHLACSRVLGIMRFRVQQVAQAVQRDTAAAQLTTASSSSSAELALPTTIRHRNPQGRQRRSLRL
jgi:hypothetical protein